MHQLKRIVRFVGTKRAGCAAYTYDFYVRAVLQSTHTGSLFAVETTTTRDEFTVLDDG